VTDIANLPETLKLRAKSWLRLSHPWLATMKITPTMKMLGLNVID
jgi:hypothetical protein